jgi:hypothetical protein
MLPFRQKFFFAARAKYILMSSLPLLILLGCMAPVPLTTPGCVSFKTVNKIPVVEGKINGKKAYFIIDTGASISILNETEANRFGFKFAVAEGMEVHGLGGHAGINEVFECEVEFGSLKIKGVKFHTRKLNEVMQAITENDHIHIAGIIGANVIDFYGVTINYKNRTISY